VLREGGDLRFDAIKAVTLGLLSVWGGEGGKGDGTCVARGRG